MMAAPIRSVAAGLLAAAAAACGGAARPGDSVPPPAGAGTPAAAAGAHEHPAPAAGAHVHAAATAPGSATIPAGQRWTEADVRFMTAMIGHHAQAVQVARLVPSRSTDPSVRTLAERIIAAQEDEIATMRQWLADRGRPAPEGHAGHHGQMPGMLTAEQIARLEQASGAEFDRLFLTYMIQHHRGATAMVAELFGSQGAGQDETVFKFASDVNVDQETEIARMQAMLRERVFGAAQP